MLDDLTRKALDNALMSEKLDRFANMMRETNQCMANRDKTGFPKDTDHCENVELGTEKLWSFHTHPHGKPTPSGMDIETTQKMGHKTMCIGLAPTGEIVCYDPSGRKILARRKVRV